MGMIWRKKLRKMAKRFKVKLLGIKGNNLPELFTAHSFPSLKERGEELLVTAGAEPLIFDGRPIAIDLFSGCGGFSLGLVQAGFRIVASVENDESAHATYCFNIPTYQKASIHCYHQDIRKLSGHQILANLGLTGDDIDLLVGGPPCQGFSHAGKRKVGDERDLLLFEFSRIVKEINPKCWAMENVPGIKTKKFSDGTLVLDEFMKGMNVKSFEESR